MARRVPMREGMHPSGFARAEFMPFGLNQSGSTPTGPVVAKTAAYTITAAEYGCAFSNEGAGVSVTFTLPTCYAGAVLFIFKITSAQTVVVDGAGSDTINGAATATNNTSETGALMLVGISPTAWICFKLGTWG